LISCVFVEKVTTSFDNSFITLNKESEKKKKLVHISGDYKFEDKVCCDIMKKMYCQKNMKM
jgi:hypothetical protein